MQYNIRASRYTKNNGSNKGASTVLRFQITLTLSLIILYTSYIRCIFTYTYLSYTTYIFRTLCTSIPLILTFLLTFETNSSSYKRLHYTRLSQFLMSTLDVCLCIWRTATPMGAATWLDASWNDPRRFRSLIGTVSQ